MNSYIRQANFAKGTNVVLKPVGGTILELANSLTKTKRLIGISMYTERGHMRVLIADDASFRNIGEVFRNSLVTNRRVQASAFETLLGTASFGRIMKRSAAHVPVKRSVSFGAYVAHAAKVHGARPYAGHMARYRS